jgi:hypothetical protein
MNSFSFVLRIVKNVISLNLCINYFIKYLLFIGRDEGKFVENN